MARVASELEQVGAPVRVVTAVTLMAAMAAMAGDAGVMVGGVDAGGPHLFWEGESRPFASASMAATAVLESQYGQMNEETAIDLVARAVRAGARGAGAQKDDAVDITVIRKDQRMRAFKIAVAEEAAASATRRSRFARPTALTLPAGSTCVISESFRPHTTHSLPPLFGGATSAFV